LCAEERCTAAALTLQISRDWAQSQAPACVSGKNNQYGTAAPFACTVGYLSWPSTAWFTAFFHDWWWNADSVTMKISCPALAPYDGLISNPFK
jgi:hypothetical protein